VDHIEGVIAVSKTVVGSVIGSQMTTITKAITIKNNISREVKIPLQRPVENFLGSVPLFFFI